MASTAILIMMDLRKAGGRLPNHYFNSKMHLRTYWSDSIVWLRLIYLFLGGLDDFAVLVVAAVWTRAMGHAHFVTVRAFGKRPRAQMVVCPAAVAPRF